MLPPIDGFAHRLPQDWALATNHLLMKAGHIAKIGECNRTQNRREMTSSIRTTMQTEAKTMRALRSNMHQIKNFKAILENTLDKAEFEMSKMQECKERLQMEKDRAQSNLEINMDRRQHRSQRPPPELVHDGAFKQLDNETTLLQDILTKLDLCIEETEDCLDHLNKIKWMLASDLADKTSSLELDVKCVDLGLTWPEPDPPSDSLPPQTLYHVPTTWKVQTMQGVELALQQIQEANDLRLKAAKVAHNAKLAEKVQYDTVQKALEKRCTVIQRMKQQMLSRLTQVVQEIAELTRTKHRLEESHGLKNPAMKITWERYQTRTLRPDRELVHDEVEHALKQQYELLYQNHLIMIKQLENVNKNLDDLHRCKAELDMNVADKNETLEMERQCYAMAPPRPKTRGVLLGWHPVVEYQGHRESNITWDTAASTKTMNY
eukprot:CAMPEP_0198201534 /NCGR_PEP_ID=MMETSP1445-20131203/4416_1 /TAXON_ID=36898 /ORGANISM="Pyramimonas sp., Strain CCMP2087" /LENGTH=433 /DNA_ID=CAMNT_0043871941 /DNA_START=514 /DNA_END=1815 /DNA_ORIENTATION=-